MLDLLSVVFLIINGALFPFHLCWQFAVVAQFASVDPVFPCSEPRLLLFWKRRPAHRMQLYFLSARGLHNQPILGEHYRPFLETSDQYQGWYIFSSFISSTCKYRSVCCSVRLYRFNCHQCIAINYKSHQSFHSFWAGHYSATRVVACSSSLTRCHVRL